jgi:tetratricopeptide (TPR) repeat protein
LFLKTATFVGGRSGAGQLMSAADWDYVISSLDVVTDLDPYFSDPYVLAEGLLAWEAGMPAEANRLIKKGIEHRTWDWRLNFFVGFNYFYFLQDYASASDYIMAAAQMPGSPAYLKTLGARLAYYGGQSRTALLFLEQMLEDAADPMMQQRLEKRHLALQRAVIIEDALEQFKQKEGRVPEFVELVDAGYLNELPADPYGGEWILMPNGRVFSTSKFAEMREQ